MNWPFILVALALLGVVMLVIGKVFAAFGLALLALEAVLVGGWMMTKMSHDALKGPPDDQGPHI